MSVTDPLIGVPTVAHPAFHVDEVGVVAATSVRRQGIPPVAMLGGVVDKSNGVMGRPAHGSLLKV